MDEWYENKGNIIDMVTLCLICNEHHHLLIVQHTLEDYKMNIMNSYSMI